MSKTITMIELLNKIANGEEMPKRIKVLGIEFEWFEECYRTCNIERKYLSDYCRLDNMLNDEVEIIEDEETIGIDSIEELHIGEVTTDERLRINELIKAVKQINNKLEDNK